jgi:uncharacterized ParB-like nuclease family protein
VQAQQALDVILETMKGTTNPVALLGVAQVVQALAGKLTDVQAQQALDVILETMKGTTNPDALQGLAQAIQALPGKLTDVQAQQVLAAVLKAKGTTNPDALQGLAQVVQALAAKLTDVQAQQALDVVLQEMRGRTGRFALEEDLAQAVQVLAGKLTDVQALHVFATGVLQSAFGWSARSDASATWAGAIARLLRRSGQRDVNAIIELLKYPIAAGPATDVLLRAMHEAIPASPGAEAGLPANLRWIAETYKRIDLSTAPACPEPFYADLACPAETAAVPSGPGGQ